MNNTYSDDIDRFNANAKSWWDTNGSYKTLHQINPLRLNCILNLCDLKGKRVLDVGCGGGILSESLAKLGAEVYAIDLAHETLKIAKQHAQDNNLHINYQCISAEELAEDGKSFEIVCCMEMLEHIPNPKAMLHTLSKLTSDWLFVSTINRNFKAWLGMVVFAEKLLRWLPEGTHNVSHFITPEELQEWAEDSNLQWRFTGGLIYDPIVGQFKQHSNTDINYLQAYQKISS